ncbi:hypothetical protein ACIRP0_29935 [Streptomyces sp. NPDC101733]|uniref:hypothetical protein n=1 Tax=unclassified Streptomyces TaxID=2593676 RepID=UPI00341E5624
MADTQPTSDRTDGAERVGKAEGSGTDDASETTAQRRARRAQFLRDLSEARELRDRVQPRRARAARMRQQMRMRTFRW